MTDFFKSLCQSIGVDPTHVSLGAMGGLVFAITTALTIRDWIIAIACGMFVGAFLAPGLYVEMVYLRFLPDEEKIKFAFISACAIGGTFIVKGVITFAQKLSGRLALKGDTL